MQKHTQRAQGFTLLELLVAIVILAIISVLCWRAISSLTTTRERLEPHAERMHALLATFGQLRIDFDQMPRNPLLYALPTQPLRVLTLDGKRCVQILRSASAADGNAASASQMVLYCARDGALVRLSTPPQRFYSANPGAALNADTLLSEVAELQVRVWRAGTGWIEPSSDADTSNTQGIDIRLIGTDGTVLHQVYLLT